MGDRNMICKHNHLISILPKYKITCPNQNQLIQKKEDETIIETFHNMLNKIQDFSNLFNFKSNYLKLRKETIIFLKEITSQFCLCDRTFHLALTLLDKIFLKIDNTKFIQSISMFCLIFAAKFVEEDTFKANLIQQTYSKFFSENYLSDEFYILNLLDYNFNITTTYDILEYFLNYKLIYFKDEKKIFEKYSKKFSVYHLAIEYLNSLIEKNIILTLTPIQISFGIIQLIRKRIGLNPFRTELYQEFGYYKQDELMNKGYEIFMKIFYKKKNKVIENKERENKCFSDKKINKDIHVKENEIIQNENNNLMSLIRKVKTL
jgi:hypothetical protein